MSEAKQNETAAGDQTPDQQGGSGKRSLRFWLTWTAKLAVSAVLLFFVADNIDLNRIGSRLAEARPLPLAGALILLLVAQLISALRLAVVMQALQTNLPIVAALRYQFIGSFFNLVLPSSVGGDAVKIWLLMRDGFGFERAFGGILIDRSSAVVGLIIIVTLAQPLYANLLPSSGLRDGIFAVLAVLLLSIPLLLLADRLPAAIRRFRLFNSLIELIRNAQVVFFTWRHGTRVVGLSILIQLAASMVYYLLAGSLDIVMPLMACIILLPLVILITTLPISISGWGVREAATVTLFGAAGVDPEGALLVSVAYGISVIIVALPGGIVWLVERRPQTSGRNSAAHS
jgi:glycosyltransferase 2 family protein